MVFQHWPKLGFAVSLGWVSRLVVDYVTSLVVLLLRWALQGANPSSSVTALLISNI
jgi:hypothetical protein